MTLSFALAGSVAVFYFIILGIGVWAARKTGFKVKNVKLNDMILANRSIGIVVGSFTMTATWVGGGYINGTTEVMAGNGGLVWCQAPIGYAISLIFAGFFFTNKMRESRSKTMLDPFHVKYGDLMNYLLYVPALSGDIFWSAAILAALGASLKVMLVMDIETAIIVSATIACMYTLLGGLYSVAYTDVVLLICMFIGLWLCFFFSFTHDAVGSISNSSDAWLGELTEPYIANYIDYGLLLIFGGIPWQVYWQIALAAKSSYVARWLSYIGALGCIVMASPAMLMGIVAASTDWNKTEYGQPRIAVEDKTLTLPLVMWYLCPRAVAFIGLGAISAAVMSSTDSSILSSSSMFARNVFGVMYFRINKTKASDTLQVWVLRLSQIIITVLSSATAVGVDSIYGLWILSSDFAYVSLFPQLVCVMYLRRSNSYGSFVAFFLGLFFRLMGGDTLLNIPAVIKYPWYDADSNTQLFPFRTLSMLISMFTLIGVSYSTDFLFTRNILPSFMDVFGCFQDKTKDGILSDKTSRAESSRDGASKKRSSFSATSYSMGTEP